MKQLELFKIKLREAGYSISVSWEHTLPIGYCQHVVIQSETKKLVNAIFHIYDSNGFASYYMIPGNTFDFDLMFLKNLEKLTTIGENKSPNLSRD